MQWNQIKPPVLADQTNVLALVATVASAAIAIPTPEKDQVLFVTCDKAFNIVFTDGATAAAALTDPLDMDLFAAGKPVPFGINSKNTHFKAIAHTTAKLLYWKGTR